MSNSNNPNPLPSIQTFRNSSNNQNNFGPGENSLDDLNFDPSSIIGDTDATNLSVRKAQNLKN